MYTHAYIYIDIRLSCYQLQVLILFIIVVCLLLLPEDHSHILVICRVCEDIKSEYYFEELETVIKWMT